MSEISQHNDKTNGGTPTKKPQGENRTSKDYYFDSYSHHGIHEEMLKDEVRSRTYQMAMLNNKHVFQDKIVLDVGCGTGILSMFAVQAGASHVYAVDCSSIIDQSIKIIKANGFADKITLIKAKMEDVELPVTSVDIIISEWMGYFLLYESMLNTVLYARDKWLKEDGVVFPDKAVLYICGVEDELMKKERIDFWDNVYGFDMSVLGEIAITEPVVDVVDPRTIVTDAVPILSIDIRKCKVEDLSFSSPFKLKPHRNDNIHAFVSYFECAFTQIDKPLGFSTSPKSTYTHWKQTIFYMRDVVYVQEGDNITGKITCRPNTNNERDLDIEIDVHFEGTESDEGNNNKVHRAMKYNLR